MTDADDRFYARLTARTDFDPHGIEVAPERKPDASRALTVVHDCGGADHCYCLEA